MGKVWLTEKQKRVVRRYATTEQLWRKGDRSFASLEYDMAAGYEVLADGIAVDRKARHGIIADAGDPEYYAAIFGNDDRAVPDLTAQELRQLREYIIRRKGGVPVRSPEPKPDPATRPRRRPSRLIAAMIRRTRAKSLV
jgi:hypothetical protein